MTLVQLYNLIEQTRRPALAVRLLFTFIDSASLDGAVDLEREELCNRARLDGTQINNFSEVCTELTRLGVLTCQYRDAAGALHEKRGRGRQVRYCVTKPVMSLFAKRSN